MTNSAELEEASPPQMLWSLATWLVGHVRVDARRVITRAFGGSNGRNDLAVLAGLDQYGPLSQADLGRRLGINLGDLVAVLKRLEADGSVLRQPDAQDRRRNTIQITARGQASLASLEAAALAAQDELLEPLSQLERGQLVELLQKLVEYHRDYRRLDGEREPSSLHDGTGHRSGG